MGKGLVLGTTEGSQGHVAKQGTKFGLNFKVINIKTLI